MPAGSFVEDIASRNLFMPDASLFTTPGTLVLPNGDVCTRILANAAAYYSDPTRFFQLPWGVSDWTIEFWVRTDSVGSGISWDMRFGNDAGANYEWIVSGNSILNNLNLSAWNASGTGNAAASTGYGPGSWQHYVVMLDCSLWVSGVNSTKMCTIYRNGTFAVNNGLNSTSTRLTVTPNPRLWLRGSAGISSSNTNIGKIAIYHRALTPTEIMDHYLAMTVA